MKASYKFIFLREKKRLIEKLSGDIDFDSLMMISKEMQSHPEFSPDMDLIVDLINCKVLLTYEEMESFVEWLGTSMQRIKGRVAFITDDPLAYGTSRVFAGLSDGLQSEINFFGSIEYAERWLDEMNKK